MEGLNRTTDAYEMLTSCIDEVTGSAATAEGQLRNLTEEFAVQFERFSKEFAVQFDRFSKELACQNESQRKDWRQREKSLETLAENRCKRLESLDDTVTNAITDVNGGLEKFGEDVRDFVTGLDKNSRDILATLSDAIDKMKVVEEKRDNDAFRDMKGSLDGLEVAIRELVAIQQKAASKTHEAA